MRVHTEIQVTQRGIQSTTCDVCGKFEHGDPEGWVHVNFGHNDWGNDSVDSQDEKDVCSAACLLKALGEIASDYGEVPHPTLSVWMGSLPYAVVRDLAAMAENGESA